MINTNEITIEDIYKVAEFLLIEEWGINSLGENASNEIDIAFANREWFNSVLEAEVDDESVDGVYECKIDILIDLKLLKTRKTKYGFAEVYKA